MLNSKKAIAITMLLLTTLLVSCGNDYDSDDYKKTTEVKENNIKNTQVVDDAIVVEISDKEEKFKKAMDEVHAMEKGAMSKIKAMYSDLEYVKQVAKGDNANLVGMGAEDWLYSKAYDVTVVVCNSMDTPAYVFNGNKLEGEKLSEVKVMMKEMMDMMGSDGMMDMEHGDMGMMGDMDMMNHNEEVTTESSIGEYKIYSAEALKEAKGKIVLFFHAEWCGTCMKSEKDIIAKGVPAGLTIFNTSFDDETELKKKYGVTTQTTFVQVDNKGNMIKKWSGGKLDKILEEVGM